MKHTTWVQNNPKGYRLPWTAMCSCAWTMQAETYEQAVQYGQTHKEACKLGLAD